MKIESLELTEEQKNLVEVGAWVGDLPEMGNIRLKVRGANNKDWSRMAQRLINAVPRKKKVNGQLDQDEAVRVSAAILLNTGLLDWENIEDDNGPVPYDKKTAAKYLEGERFRAGVQTACERVAQGIEDKIEEIVGN
jgi:hypothetical protein